jgi:hypothetical protein
MYENKHSGKMAVLVQASELGLKNTDEARRTGKSLLARA